MLGYLNLVDISPPLLPNPPFVDLFLNTELATMVDLFFMMSLHYKELPCPHT